jgi:hypothetical protein
MTLQPNGPAPYTTALAATSVLDGHRDRGSSGPLTPDSIIRGGVGESLASRTLNSFKQLGLLDEEYKPTQQFEDFRLARGDEEYRNRLQEWLRGVYADVLQYADPSTDSLEKVTEAFRTYEPASQKRAMASLLLGLWRYAGLPVAAQERTVPGVSPRPPRVVAPKHASAGRVAPATGRRPTPQPTLAIAASFDGLPAGLVGLLHQIPQNGQSWTQEKRDAFIQAFSAVLDFSVPIGAPPLAGPSPFVHEETEVSTS